MNKINTVTRDHEDLVAARLMSHLSQNPHSRQGNIPSPIDSNKNLHFIERAETKAGMIAEVYEDSKGKLFLIYRGSEVISHKTFIPGTQSNNATSTSLIRAPCSFVKLLNFCLMLLTSIPTDHF